MLRLSYVYLLALSIAQVSALEAQAPARRARASLGGPSEAVFTFLRDWVRAGGNEYFDSTGAESETWAIAAPLPLERSQLRATAVYLSRRYWCGTGGCRLLVVTDDRAGTVRFVADVGLAQLPIRVLPTRHAEWPDLAVTVFGGGERRPHLALLRYDGQRYRGETTADLPEVPTFAEMGYPRMQASGAVAMFGPTGMTPALTERLSKAVQAALADPGVKEKILKMGMEARSSTPQAPLFLRRATASRVALVP